MQFLKFIKYSPLKKSFAIYLVFPMFFLLTTVVSAQKEYVIVLDAGHGGKDPGNLGNGYKEKNIALKVVIAVGRELQRTNGFKVIFTRRTDDFVELHKRAKIANKSKADLFVSVHCDSYSKERAYGAGTFVLGLSGDKGNFEIAKRENASILYEDDYEKNYDYNPNSPASVIGLSVLQEENLDNSLGIASLIQSNFSKLKRFDRKVKQENFLVLRETVMPSVLVELGFLTNNKEGRFLNSKKGQLKMAGGIAKAIVKYVKGLQLNTVNTAVIKKEVKKKPVVIKKVISKAKIKKIAPKPKVVKAKSIIIKDTKTTTSVIAKTLPVNNKIKKKIKKDNITFRVQIAASVRKLTANNFNFKGLEDVEELKINEYYKYYYGNYSSFQYIKVLLREARNLGHKGAFVVAFKNGIKIPIKEALKNQ